MCWPQKSTLLGGIDPTSSLQAKPPTVRDLDFAETVESFIQPDFEELPRSVDRRFPASSMPQRPAQADQFRHVRVWSYSDNGISISGGVRSHPSITLPGALRDATDWPHLATARPAAVGLRGSSSVILTGTGEAAARAGRNWVRDRVLHRCIVREG